MSTLSYRAFVLLFVAILSGGCVWYVPPPISIPGAATLVLTGAPPPTQPLTTVLLDGTLTLRATEISGLAWYGDTLILLPQFPEKFGRKLFALPKAAIVDQLTGRNPVPLEAQVITFDDVAVQQQLLGSEGYEAIAFDGNRAYLTIETKRLSGMLGYVVGGEMIPEQNRLVLNPAQLTPVEPQAGFDNMADEALVLIHNQVGTIYEANGFLVNSAPVMHLFDAATLTPIGVTPFPNIEYRITDATALDENGRFWVTNYFSPETRSLRPFLLARGATGPVNTQAQPVERLLEFAVTSEGIVRTETPPLALELLPNLDGSNSTRSWIARNWEGVVRLETAEVNGFLIVTDSFPDTILAFVPLP